MFITIETVRNGDIIVEGRDETKVSKVEVEACSSKGTHINGKYCYNRGQFVQVKQATKDVEELTDEDLDEMIDSKLATSSL